MRPGYYWQEDESLSDSRSSSLEMGGEQNLFSVLSVTVCSHFSSLAPVSTAKEALS